MEPVLNSFLSNSSSIDVMLISDADSNGIHIGGIVLICFGLIYRVFKNNNTE
jgi:hypothetical protein